MESALVVFIAAVRATGCCRQGACDSCDYVVKINLRAS